MKRSSGVLLHISGLFGDYSVGSLGKEAREWIDFLSDCGFGVWQILPICLPDAFHSPYQSYSAFSLNPMFIDLPTLKEEGLLTAEELQSAKQNSPYACEFDRLEKERFSLLSKAAKRFKTPQKIADFLQTHSKIDEFCRFMALKKRNDDRPWNEWTVFDLSENDETLLTWQFSQYECYREWLDLKSYANEKGIRIVGDLPIYVSVDSSDVYFHRDLFQLNKDGRPECVAGVPPDYFSEDGQLWGNPLYDWKRMKEDDYGWWRERIEQNLELFDGLRIDHFRGLESYYSIPATETTAKNGVWKKGPGMDLIRAILPTCREKLMIAEDLGVITKEVRTLVEKSGFPGMRVLQFGFLGEKNSPHQPHNYPENCVAYTGTHDNNTLLGYVWEMSENDRRSLLDYCGYRDPDWNRCYDSILQTMFASHAGLLMLPVQDLLLYGSDTRLNVPGRSEGNWSYRITKEQLQTIDRNKFRHWNEIYGRI